MEGKNWGKILRTGVMKHDSDVNPFPSHLLDKKKCLFAHPELGTPFPQTPQLHQQWSRVRPLHLEEEGLPLMGLTVCVLRVHCYLLLNKSELGTTFL